MKFAQYAMIRGHRQSGISRRDFTRFTGLGFLAGALEAAPSRGLQIGHTGITWGNDTEAAISDISRLGFYGFETFGNVLEKWETQGGLRKVLDDHNLPLISAYCSFNLIDPAKRKDELEKMRKWGLLLRKNGGHVTVLGPNSVPRDSYDFKASKTDIVETLNECGKMLTGMGIVPVLHQHTGTCIESRDEVYSVLDAIDSRYVKFGPDIGQLQKGGVDPVRVVRDYLPLVRHMHLKDFSGGDAYLGYCPLGQGKVDIPAILDLAAKADMQGKVMVELDPSPNMPIAAGETAKIAKAYLEKLGVGFRS
ncbi:MAG TPA: sugar phosphate isomerase/epimerase [Bryobacteraceae bacterium]|nr:sugar phosphate isomerase/epimerase [Bryobacteraceae bacterium]